MRPFHAMCSMFCSLVEKLLVQGHTKVAGDGAQVVVGDGLTDAMLQTTAKKPDEIEAIVESLIEEFHIGHVRDRMGMQLSGGERRRVEIARCLALEPNFILLDEPFAGVDPIAVADIQQIILHVKNRGIGILITDHNVRETLGIVDKAYILSNGKILLEGTPDEIANDPIAREHYLGDNFKL